jgi:hypothetical protein
MPKRTKKKPRRARPQATTRRRTPPAPQREPNEFERYHAELSQREQRIDEILGMMVQGQWFAGASHRALAQRWGIVPGTVEHLAAEANRLLRFVFRTDDEGRKDLVARVLQNFEVIRVRGMVGGSPAHLRVALDANETLARYLGLEPPKQMRVRAEDELDGLTPEQLEEVAREGSLATQRFEQAKAAAARGGGTGDAVH